jgi:predicted transposase YbfD/YdcC
MDQAFGTSVKDHFLSLSDPRIFRKTHHRLIDVIVIALCAVIAGADDWVEIAAFGREKESWFKTFLELPNGIPSHDTFGRVFSLISPGEFAQCFVSWIRSAFPMGDSDIIAIDGKTARRSHDRANGKSPIHMVSAWAVQHRLILGQVKTEDKSNEITAIPELLKLLDLNGCVVTTDAMGCQKEIARQIVDQGGDYVFSLKGNQGNLHKEVALLFEDAKKNNYWDLAHETCTTVDGGHGRVETRSYTITANVDWFEEKSKWKELTTFAMVESTREIGDQTTQETRYFISSLPCDAKRFAEAARGHWGIENGLHWCLDISFREDDSRVRNGHAPENLAILRRFALTLIKNDTQRKIGVKASRKRAGWSNYYLLHLLRLV